MTKRISTIISIATAACLVAAGPALAKKDCARTTAVGVTDAIDRTLFQGTAEVAFDGEPAQTFEVFTHLISTKDNGSNNIIATTSHVFFSDFDPVTDDQFCESGENCFETLDHAVIHPIDELGLYRLNTNMKIIGGEGIYEDACGNMHLRGELDFGVVPAHSEWLARGKVCNCPSSRGR